MEYCQIKMAIDKICIGTRLILNAIHVQYNTVYDLKRLNLKCMYSFVTVSRNFASISKHILK